MAVGNIEFFSKALGFPVTYTVILPNDHIVGPGPYPVLLQLHGMGDTLIA
jgi:hypothetical protein